MPASNARALDKARTLPVDGLILDLEDAVAPDAKPARTWQTRKIILRIYFDGAKTPNVEAPLGDFFGVMHGLDYYPVNTPFISVKEHNGYECFFEMPFAKSARIEIANAPDASNNFYLQVAWHRYPEQELKEKRRFCALARRRKPPSDANSAMPSNPRLRMLPAAIRPLRHDLEDGPAGVGQL